MNCEWCNTHIGKRIFLVSSSWSLCLSCNADCTQFFPRWVTYIGKNEGQHQFIYDEPVICPGCGSRSDGCQQFCDNDGETIELPPAFRTTSKGGNKMIKILILSRSDLHRQRRDTPQDQITMNDMNNEAFMTGDHYHYILFQEGDGPVTVIRDREDYPIKMILEEVLRELPKENK